MGDVLPSSPNHGWDAVRYGIDGYIQQRDINAQWERLGQ
jgi:hypothetical protein